MENFTDSERKLLEPFFSNMDKSIFVLTNLPEVVKGALFSRYSRSSKSLRRVLLEEFLQSDDLSLAQSLGTPKSYVQTKKAEEFYERVLVGYGDDSVAELANAHIAIEDVSILATKTLEDSRIGLSPLEKSTRYVYFDNKRDEKWLYHREKTLMNSEYAKLYEETCDFCFQTYANLIPKISTWIMEKEPMQEGVTERAYKSTIRAKTCDLLRGLLPASTLTNMGMMGNGRAYEYLLTKLYSSDLSEFKDIGSIMQQELGKVIPSFVKRANDKYGQSMQQYWISNEKSMSNLAQKIHNSNSKNAIVTLVDFENNAQNKAIAYGLYPYSNLSLTELYQVVSKMSESDKKTAILSYIGNRDNRRHKPSRAFELINYSFDVCANYGAYRDMHRHRILTQQRQLLTPYLGYKLPKEIIEAGFDKEFKEVMEKTKSAFEIISKKYKKEAQYVVPLAYNIRWHMSFSLREAYHMLELRSSMQGHIDYREIAQAMFKEIEKVHPLFASGMKFMDMKEYSLERLEAEKRIDKKMEEISKKYSK